MNQGILFVFVLLSSLTVWAEEPAPYYIYFHEKRGAEAMIFEARVEGKRMLILRQTGIDHLPFPREGVLEVKGLPPLELQAVYQLEKTETILGEPVEKYRGTYRAEAKAEILSLNENEAQTAQSLKPFGIEQMELTGAGWRRVFSKTQRILAEQFQLEGFIEKEGVRKPWKIDYARAPLEVQP